MILRTILSCLYLLMHAASFSQNANLIYYGTEQGLPQSSVYAMTQDHSGNLWMGTLGGVCRYDGVFKNFSKKNGLAENWVTSICADRNGDIWFGHWAGGISRYHAKNETLETIAPAGVSLTKQISKIYEDRSGSLWFLTESDGILKYTPDPENKETGTLKRSPSVLGITSEKTIKENVIAADAAPSQLSPKRSATLRPT